jgi:AraC family transcriptional regulator
MDRFDGVLIEIEAEMSLSIGHVQIVQKFWNEPIDIVATAHTHHLELTLLPHSDNSKGCFLDDWGPHRFEAFGGMFLLPAQHTIHAKSSCQRQNSIVCTFDPAAVASWFDDEVDWTEGRLQGSLDVVNANIRSLMLRIGEEIRSPGFASETMVELMAGQVALELSRHLRMIDESRATSGLSPWRLKLIDERLANGGSPPSLTELAALCHLSVRHLTRAFRVSRGQSIGSYLADRRIDQARRLLDAGASIKSIAYTLGFSAPSNFTAAFLRATGETPRQYRQRVNRRSCANPSEERSSGRNSQATVVDRLD